MTDPKNYSYELNPDMVRQLSEQFDIGSITSRFTKVIEGYFVSIDGIEERKQIIRAKLKKMAIDYVRKCYEPKKD